MPNSKRQTISNPEKSFFDFGRFGHFRISLAFGALAFGIF